MRKRRRRRNHSHPGLFLSGTVVEILRWSLDSAAVLVRNNDAEDDDSSTIFTVVALKRRGIPDTLRAEPQHLLELGHWEPVTNSAEFSYWRVSGLEDQFQFDAEVISPASEQVICKFRPGKRRILSLETPEVSVAGKDKRRKPDWVANIVNGVKEIDRVVYRSSPQEPLHSRFLLVPDTNKWLQFPKSSTTPYLLAFCEDPTLESLRDLRADHIVMLTAMKIEGMKFLESHCGLDPRTVRVFFHYPPQFWWLHVHFCTLTDPRADVAVERAHLIDDVIMNLSKDSEYYAKRTIMIVRTE